MGAMESQITSLTIVYSTVHSDADQRKHQSSASLAFVREVHRSPGKSPVTRKMFPFDDVAMTTRFVNDSIAFSRKQLHDQWMKSFCLDQQISVSLFLQV